MTAEYTCSMTELDIGATRSYNTSQQMRLNFEQVDGKWLLTSVLDPYYP